MEKVYVNGEFVCDVSSEALVPKMRRIIFEKVLDTNKSLSISDGLATDALKKDAIVVAWITPHEAEVYQTKEIVLEGFFYNSTGLQNELLFKISNKETVTPENIPEASLETSQNGVETSTEPAESITTLTKTSTEPAESITTLTENTTEPAESITTLTKTITKPAESITIPTESEDTPKPKALEPLNIVSHEDSEEDFRLFREKYEPVLNDLVQQVTKQNEVIAFLQAQLEQASTEKVSKNKVIIYENPIFEPRLKSTEKKGVVTNDSIVKEITKFDFKRLKSRAERDKLMEKRRRHKSILQDKASFEEFEWEE